MVWILEKRSDSYLTWAKSLDVEVYRAASATGQVGSKVHRPHSFEMTEQSEILAALFSLVQQLIKVTARDKKYQPKQWPRPKTAAEIVRREDADRGYDQLMSEVTFIPDDQFEAFIAENSGEQTLIRHDMEQ